jgi:hypothetical protein
MKLGLRHAPISTPDVCVFTNINLHNVFISNDLRLHNACADTDIG